MDIVEMLAAARDFPGNTCPASRHAQMIAEALIKGQTYHMLAEEPEHCGESIGAAVASLYEARTEITRLRAALESIANNTCCDGCREAALVARAALHHPRQEET